MEQAFPAEQTIKAEHFRSLHRHSRIFVVPNPWDAGSAKILEQMGFEAMATTSAGLAFSLGKPDGERAVTREETLKNAREIVASTRLPVSADLENGFGDAPETCAETILLAARAGLAGGSIEDATGIPGDPIYPFDLAVARVRAAVKAAASLPFPFTLTARAENLIHGKQDLPDTINRLKAYSDAGAHVLFAPGLQTTSDIAAVVAAVSPRPVNVVMGLSGSVISLKNLEELGVRRVSLGSSLSRAAYSAYYRALEEIHTKGTFDFTSDVLPYGRFNDLFRSSQAGR